MMLPSFSNSDHHMPKKSNTQELRNSTFSLIKSLFSLKNCAWIVLTILIQLLIVVFLNRASLWPSTLPAIQDNFQAPSHEKDCEFGTVYVYDLPPVLNKELIENCQDLDPWPWSSKYCSAVSNGGFGPSATGLDGMVPENLIPAWYWTEMYAAEVIYHERILSYKCRTRNLDEATAFYIPFYVGLAVGKYLWFNHTAKDRDRHSLIMLNWVKEQPSWKRTNGSDHFIMLGRLTWDFRRLHDSDTEWGTSFIYMPLMKNVLHLTVERSQWDELEFSVPYPTAFHPRSQSDIQQWQSFIRARKRSSLFCFVGATRKSFKNDFRGLLMNYCKNESDSCRLVDCSVTHCYDGAPVILKTFLDSDFCLQPKGDGFTRRSTFDCMLSGAIPVYFWEGSFKDQYQWHLPGAAEAYSVFIDNNGVRNGTDIRSVLERYSREEVNKMRETIIDFMPKFLYSSSNADLGSVKDAFDIAMDGVLRRFMEQKRSASDKEVNT